MPCLTELHSLFYPNGIKIIPNNIYELLTSVALAHMIMGDGSWKRYGLIICTDSYTVKDIVRLMNVLIIKFRLECNLRAHKKNQYRIYIRQHSMPSLLNIVYPYMHPSMLYKLTSSLSNSSNHKKIEVFDLRSVFFSLVKKKPAEKTTTTYNSIGEAAKALNCNESSIRSNLKSNSKKPYKNTIYVHL